jgi:hypothetical protein
VESPALQQGLHQIKHGRPFRKQDNLPVLLIHQLVDKVFKFDQFARITRRHFIDQEGAVRCHPADQQSLLQPEKIHLGEVFLRDDDLDDPHLAIMDIELLGGRGNSPDLGRPRRQLGHHHFSSPAEKDRFQLFSEFIQISVSLHLSLLIHHPVPIVETESRAETAVIDEFHHGIELIQSIFERRSRKNQGKGGSEGLHDLACLGLPVLDSLPLIENDEVPFDPLDGRKVAEDLLIVADGERKGVVILSGSLLCRP